MKHRWGPLLLAWRLGPPALGPSLVPHPGSLGGFLREDWIIIHDWQGQRQSREMRGSPTGFPAAAWASPGPAAWDQPTFFTPTWREDGWPATLVWKMSDEWVVGLLLRD